MIIIIDEASAKLASFYYHDEIFKPEMASVSGELQDELQEKLQDEQQNNLCVYEIEIIQDIQNLQITPRKLIREI